MSNKNMSGDNEEVYVFVDEDGNEIIVDDDLNEVENVEEYMSEDEITMEEEYELKDAFEEDEDDDDAVYDGRDGILGSVANKMLVVFGVMIALIAIGIGIFFMSRKGGGAADFSKVGKEFTAIGVVGGSKIEEITSLRGAQLDALYQAQGSYSYDEADTEDGITNVSITLTSILKDLKVKFVNSKGKLIANVPFEVEVTGPDGKSTKWTDTDKDGIIYQTELSGGAYSVKVIPLSGYETMYDFSKAEKQSCSVKTQLDYQKVDVKNEIKSSSKVAATEDVSKKDTVEEGKNKDTVAFVESAKKPSSSGYTPVARSSAKNPMDQLTKSLEAGLSRFKRLSGPVNLDDTSENNNQGSAHTHSYGEWQSNGDGTHYRECEATDCPDADNGRETGNCNDGDSDGKCDKCGYQMTTPPAPHTHTYGSWTSNNDGTHSHTCTDATCQDTDGKKTETENCNYTAWERVSGSQTHKPKCGVCGYVNASATAEACTDSNGDHKCDKCNGDMSVTYTAGLELTADATSVAKGGKAVVTAKPSITPTPSGTVTTSYTWSVSGTNVTMNQDGAKATFTFANAGDHIVSCKVEYKDGAGAVLATKENTITIKVTDNITLSLDRTAKKAIFVGGDINGSSFTIKANLSGGPNDGKEYYIQWTSGDANYVKVNGTQKFKFDKDGKASVSCTVEGIKPTGGNNVSVTATYAGLDNKATNVKASCAFVVGDPRHDNVTKLTDNSGNQLYVLDKASNKYREATYADYFTGVDLYTPVAVTYIYTGWWQLDGKTYYFDANGNKVTGDQVICGAKYSFGSDGALKSGTGTFGIDVSTWNGTIDWNRVAKSGVSYAIIRCGFRGTTVGGLVADNKFEANVKNAQAAGIKVGIYFFSQATTEAEAVEEASTCLTMIDVYKVKPTYPIFIDIEGAGAGARAANLNKSQRTAVAKAFCKTITNSGYKAGVYSNKSWLTNNIDTASLTGYTIWLAQYAQSPTYTATRYDLWQYSDAGSIAGISGKVDLDLSYMGY
ncbi:MAG: hypothetical protein J6X48_10525 [Lachnospiraceae bacterium]|nr:hypothetical protein [Lachnospiraceae bacterium]